MPCDASRASKFAVYRPGGLGLIVPAGQPGEGIDMAAKRNARAWLAAGLAVGLALGGVAGGALAQAGRGAMDIQARGVEDVIKQLNAVPDNPRAQQAALVLLLIQGLGKKQPEGNRTRYDYHVEAQPDGHILINGLDISVLIQAAGGKPPR
jgi:hypothetical protein